MGSTVIRVRSPFGVFKTPEIVNEPDHDVSVDAQRVGQLLLSRAVRGCQAIHHREVTGCTLNGSSRSANAVAM